LSSVRAHMIRCSSFSAAIIAGSLRAFRLSHLRMFPSPAVREAIVSRFWQPLRRKDGLVSESTLDARISIKSNRSVWELGEAALSRRICRRPARCQGVCANLVTYTAFTKPGDVMMALAIPSGAHFHGKKDFKRNRRQRPRPRCGILRLRPGNEMNIDVDKRRRK